MKKLLFIVALLYMLIPSGACAFEGMTRYNFGDGEFYIWLPDYYDVMHEDATEEELRENGMYAADGAKSFLDSFGMELFASWDNDNNGLIVNLYKDMFDEDVEVEDRSSAELLAEDWAGIIEKQGRIVLFAAPVVGEYDNFGKVVNMMHDESGTTYYVDYVLVEDRDIISLAFTSEDAQFNIEEGYIFDLIADRTGGFISSVLLGKK